MGIKKALKTIGDERKSREEVSIGSGQWEEYIKDNHNLLYNLASDRSDPSLFRVKKLPISSWDLVVRVVN